MRGWRVVALGAVAAVWGCGGAGTPDVAPSGRAASGGGAGGAPVVAVAGPELHVLAIGDSLFAGYGLATGDAYPVRLEAALRAGGLNVRVVNASVSGDTTGDGAARLAFTLDGLAARPDLVMICLGGNDMLRGLPPAQTEANLEAMLAELDRRHIPALLMGMLAAPNLGPDYAKAFNPTWPRLARRHHAALVPFFLQAVIGRPGLQQADHIHPTTAGIAALVTATGDAVRAALEPGKRRWRGQSSATGGNSALKRREGA